MRRIITHHDGHELAESLIITADDLGVGGASHDYAVFSRSENTTDNCARIAFQRGPRGDRDSRAGLTHEVLLAIVADRLECFQAGSLPDEHNARAIEHIRQAMVELKARTDERAARGVLGTMKPTSSVGGG